MTETVNVRAVEGRIARESPHGPFIPEDTFVPVTMTPYIRRLIEVHGDLEVEEAKREVAPAAPAPKPKSDKPQEKEPK